MGTPLETSHDRAAITRALERLQRDGTLTQTQVEAVLGELDQLETSATEGAPRGGTRGNRFAEAAAYAGAVLVAASGVLLVVQQWNDLTRLGRVAVLAVISLLLAAAGLLLVTARPRGRTALLDPRRSVRRRAAGTVLTAAAVTAAGTGLLLVPDHALLTAGLVAVAVMLPSTAVAPTAVSETAALGAVLLLIAGVFEEADPSLAVAIPVLAAAGLGWALLSTTALVTLPRLALTLGLAVTLWSCAAGAFSGEQPATAIAVTLLALLAAGGLAGYIRTASWPYLAAATGALAVLVLRLTSDSLGPVLAALLTGLVLLGAGALVLVRQRSGLAR